ncbi:hypothetical protein J6590_003842 [Homalodisca vitripennis]|nr:hypothetical protein J6590_003842 [Homalodisca vitripennis]
MAKKIGASTKKCLSIKAGFDNKPPDMKNAPNYAGGKHKHPQLGEIDARVVNHPLKTSGGRDEAVSRQRGQDDGNTGVRRKLGIGIIIILGIQTGHRTFIWISLAGDQTGLPHINAADLDSGGEAVNLNKARSETSCRGQAGRCGRCRDLELKTTNQYHFHTNANNCDPRSAEPIKGGSTTIKSGSALSRRSLSSGALRGRACGIELGDEPLSNARHSWPPRLARTPATDDILIVAGRHQILDGQTIALCRSRALDF